MSPEDVEILKASIRDELKDHLGTNHDENIKLERSLGRLFIVDSFPALVVWMKGMADWEQALAWLLFTFCPTANDADLQLLLMTDWNS